MTIRSRADWRAGDHRTDGREVPADRPRRSVGPSERGRGSDAGSHQGATRQESLASSGRSRSRGKPTRPASGPGQPGRLWLRLHPVDVVTGYLCGPASAEEVSATVPGPSPVGMSQYTLASDMGTTTDGTIAGNLVNSPIVGNAYEIGGEPRPCTRIWPGTRRTRRSVTTSRSAAGTTTPVRSGTPTRRQRSGAVWLPTPGTSRRRARPASSAADSHSCWRRFGRPARRVSQRIEPVGHEMVGRVLGEHPVVVCPPRE